MRRQARQSQPGDDAAPILVPAHVQSWTFGDHLRLLAEHAGTLPPTLDEFGRGANCVRRGWFRPNGRSFIRPQASANLVELRAHNQSDESGNWKPRPVS